MTAKGDGPRSLSDLGLTASRPVYKLCFCIVEAKLDTAIVENETNTTKNTAQEILSSIEEISQRANDELDAKRKSRFQQNVANNPFTASAAVNNQARARNNNVNSYEALIGEPSIARVVVRHEEGHEETYYFCRKGSLNGLKLKLAELPAPIGTLASLPVGAEHDLPNGRCVTVLENVRFIPQSADYEWDALKAEFRGEGGARTIESLRKLLREEPGIVIDENIIDALLKEESAAEFITDGIRRNVIEKMDLRDQPILDQYQNRIFRLPLDSQLLILGAPGTGKTTTLIRRLGQKVDPVFLDDDEKQLLTQTGAAVDDERGWIMFTPTELLKLYVKEAFNREGISASDKQIRTWSDFRENLARNEFPVLKSAVNKGRLIMKDAVTILTPAAEADLIGLFEDFDQWQNAAYWQELQTDAERLSDNPSPTVAEIGQSILSAINTSGDTGNPATFLAFTALTAMIREAANLRKNETDKKLEETLTLQLNKDRAFLDKLATFIEELSEVDEETDDQEIDEEEADAPRVGRRAAMSRYKSVSRSYARARAQGKQVSRNSSTGRIIEWLADRIITEDLAKEIGKSLIIQSALRRFINPVQGYIDKIPNRYRRYRQARQTEGHWYQSEGFALTDAHPLEVDLILLTILRNIDSLIAGVRNSDEGSKQTLDRLQKLYYTQVLVDEATDFSPIQLACMAAISRPRIRSFFACGDFNQRFTSCGVRSIEQVKWAIPKIAEEHISIAYRHSNQLHRLAQAIIMLSGEKTTSAHVSDEYTNNEGYAPVLALNLDKEDVLAAWLSARIQEIEKSVDKLPSIAILVNDEQAVGSVAKALKPAVEHDNIQVIPCFNGQVLGRDNGAAVRIFSVEHIKGLEFEAVFFVGLDKLAETHHDLFDKYLYVGATRAASFFGITCEAGLPSKLAPIQELFQESWKN